MRGAGRADGRSLQYALVVVMALSFSTASIFVLASGLPGPSAATWRLLVSSAILFVLALRRPRGPKGRWRDPGLVAASLASGALLAIHFDMWMSSLYLLPVGVSVSIVDSYPAFIWAFGTIVYGERYGPFELVGSIITVAAVALLSTLGPGTGGLPPGWPIGVALALGGMVAMIGYVLLGKWVRRRWSSVEYAAHAYGFGACVSLAISLATGTWAVPSSGRSWLSVLALALVPMIGGHTLMNFLLGRSKVLQSTIAMAFEPAGASVLALPSSGANAKALPVGACGCRHCRDGARDLLRRLIAPPGVALHICLV